MNENIDLTKILEGLEGIKLYCSLCGECTLIKIRKFVIEIELSNGATFILEKDGKHPSYPNGECIVFPSEYQRDWSKFVRPIKKDTPIVVSDDGLDWNIAYYKCYRNNEHRIYYKSNPSDDMYDYNYIIPFDKFNPNDIEGSLEYNIQK